MPKLRLRLQFSASVAHFETTTWTWAPASGSARLVEALYIESARLQHNLTEPRAGAQAQAVASKMTRVSLGALPSNAATTGAVFF